MMERCQKCTACLRHCPTGAITSERFLLRAERCITFHNEKPSDVPFPAWLDASWHNCLVGCMICQKVCPANKDVVKWIEAGATFDDEETDLILNGVSEQRLPRKTVEKLKKLDMIRYYDVQLFELFNGFPRQALKSSKSWT